MYNNESLIETNCISKRFPTFNEDDFWTQINVYKELDIPTVKPNIEEVCQIIIDVHILSQKIVKTPKTIKCNPGGETLSGKKLIIEGIIKQKVFYIADVLEQSLHAVHFAVPFFTFIVIPKEIGCHDRFKIDYYIEDIFVTSLTKRQIFSNITLSLNANLINCLPCNSVKEEKLL